MRFEPSRDWPLIRAIMTHVRIYPYISDDFSPKREDFHPNESPDLIYLLVSTDAPLGLFGLHPQNSICWEVHTCLLPMCWGPVAKRAAIGMQDWLWRNTKCQRLVTNVPVHNRLALKFAKDAGLTEYGFNPNSFLKDGVLLGQHMLGISRPGATCL